MKICENCECKHDGSYGSGRFCSTKCARGFSTKAKRKEINEKISKTAKKIIKNGKSFGFIKAGSNLTKYYEKECLLCKENYISYRNSIFCSRSCQISFNNKKRKGSKLKEKTKKKISKSVLQNYKDGKRVYGGITKWYNYKDIKVQGTYELRTCKILDKWKDNGKIKDWEYTNDRIEYIGTDGKTHNYLLDFKVFENSDSFYYIETKGYEKVNDKLKWKAVKDNGNKLEVWFDGDINGKE